MELALIKLLFYGFGAIIITLFVYVTALALFLYKRIDKIKAERE